MSVFFSQEGKKWTEQANFSLEHPLSVLAKMSETSYFPIQSPALSAGRKPWKVVALFKSSCCVFCRPSLIAGEWWYQGFGSLFRLVSFSLCPSPSTCHCFRLVFSSLLISLSPCADFLPCSPQVPLALPSTHPSPSIPQSQQMERRMVHPKIRQETPREIYDEPSTSCAHDCREVCVPSLLP